MSARELDLHNEEPIQPTGGPPDQFQIGTIVRCISDFGTHGQLRYGELYTVVSIDYRYMDVCAVNNPTKIVERFWWTRFIFEKDELEREEGSWELL